MTKHPRRGRFSVEIDAFDQEVCCDDQIATCFLSDDGCIIADSDNQARRMLSQLCLFAKVSNEIEFGHLLSSEVINLWRVQFVRVISWIGFLR